ncbi:hypothetical protein NQ315_014143, partial [Exocentrus adspersus]
VQEERGPRKPKFTQITLKPPSSVLSSITSQVITNNSYAHFRLLDQTQGYELAAQIFLTAVKGARCNSGFGQLSRQSQNTFALSTFPEYLPNTH